MGSGAQPPIGVGSSEGMRGWGWEAGEDTGHGGEGAASLPLGGTEIRGRKRHRQQENPIRMEEACGDQW